MVRTHNPSDAMLDRMREWSASAAASGCMFVASVDISQPPGQEAATALERMGIAVHAYSAQDLRDAYPVLDDECLKRVDTASKGEWQRWGNRPRPGEPTRPASLAWGFHIECINLWAQLRVNRGTWDHVWVLEDDVGCSGDLVSCLASYATDSSDLIGPSSSPVFRTGRRGRALGSKWCWARTGSDAFLARVPTVQRLKSAEHVQRFSRRLLDTLHGLASQPEGAIAAWSESACIAPPRVRRRDLPHSSAGVMTTRRPCVRARALRSGRADALPLRRAQDDHATRGAHWTYFRVQRARDAR